MPNRVPWTSRTFNFDFPADLYPELTERLRGTIARVREMAGTAAAAGVLTRREGRTWSIQENIGHLADLDDLFASRLDEFDAEAAVLKAADMTNRKTHEAEHNARPIAEVVDRFARGRDAIVARLESLPPAAFARSSRHPRLDTPMRLVDLLLFKAEHDDYHMARIRELSRRFGAAERPGPPG